MPNNTTPHHDKQEKLPDGTQPKMELRIGGRWVLIQPQIDEQTPGGLELPPKYRTRGVNRGWIVSAGKEAITEFGMPLNFNDRCYYQKGMGSDLEDGGNKYKIMDVKHLFGKFVEAEKAPEK